MKHKLHTLSHRSPAAGLPTLASVGFVPFGEFGRLFERLFDDFGSRAPSGPLHGWYTAPAGEFLPRFELEKTAQGLRLHAELPGVSNDDLELSVDGDVLTLSGHKKVVERSEQDRMVHSERHYGSFERRVTLPLEIDSSKVTASFENGVLTVDLPSKQPIDSKRTIRIEAK